MEELLGGQGIGAVPVSNELEVFWQFSHMAEGHSHGHDAGADATVIRDLIADDGAFGGVHDKPDVGLYTPDFDISLIGSECAAGAVIIVINKGLYADSSGFAVVGDLLVGDGDVIEVLEGLGGFPEGKSEVDMECQAQGHDVGIELAELQGRGVFGKRIKVHLKKIYREFTVNVVEFIFVFAEIFFEVVLINLFEVVEIVRAPRVDALVDDEVLAVFLLDKRIATVRTAEVQGREAVTFRRREPGIADFAEELAFITVILIKVDGRGLSPWAGAAFRDVAVRAASHGLNGLPITPLIVGQKILPCPVLFVRLDAGKFIRFELVVFRRVRIIKGPLLKREIFADKRDQEAVLLIKGLN